MEILTVADGGGGLGPAADVSRFFWTGLSADVIGAGGSVNADSCLQLLTY